MRGRPQDRKEPLWNHQRHHHHAADADGDDDSMDIDRYSTAMSEITTPVAIRSSKDSLDNARPSKAELRQQQKQYRQQQEQQQQTPPLKSILRQPTATSNNSKATQAATEPSILQSILKNSANPFSETIGAFNPTSWWYGKRDDWHPAVPHRPSTTFSSGSTSWTYDEYQESEPPKSSSIARKYRHKAMAPVRSMVVSTMSGSSYTNSEDITEDDDGNKSNLGAAESRNDHPTINLSATTNSQRHRHIQELREEMMMDTTTSPRTEPKPRQQYQNEEQPAVSMKQELLEQRHPYFAETPVLEYNGQPVVSVKQQLLEQRQSRFVENPVREYNEELASPRSPINPTRQQRSRREVEKRRRTSSPQRRGRREERQNYSSRKSGSRSRSHSKHSKSTAERRNVSTRRSRSPHSSRRHRSSSYSSRSNSRDRSNSRGRSRSRCDVHSDDSFEDRRSRSRSSHSRSRSTSRGSRRYHDHDSPRDSRRRDSRSRDRSWARSRRREDIRQRRISNSQRQRHRSRSRKSDRTSKASRKKHRNHGNDNKDSFVSGSKRQRSKKASVASSGFDGFDQREEDDELRDQRSSKRRQVDVNDEESTATSMSQSSFAKFFGGRKWSFGIKRNSQRRQRKYMRGRSKAVLEDVGSTLVHPTLTVATNNMAVDAIPQDVIRVQTGVPYAAPIVPSPTQQVDITQNQQQPEQQQAPPFSPPPTFPQHHCEDISKEEGVEMIPIVNANGSNGGLLIMNSDKFQYQWYGDNGDENENEKAMPPPPARPPHPPVEEALEPTEAQLPTSPGGIFSQDAVASPTSTIRARLSRGKHRPTSPEGVLSSDAVASPTSTIRHLFPVGKQLDALHDLKKQQLREQQILQEQQKSQQRQQLNTQPSEQQKPQQPQQLSTQPSEPKVATKEVTKSDSVPEAALEDVIVAISNFTLQAQKLGLSESKILDVLKDSRVSNNSKKGNDVVKQGATAIQQGAVVNHHLQGQPGDHRLNTTIDVVKKTNSNETSAVSSLTFKGPQ